MRLLQKRAEKIFYEISFLIRYFSRQPHSISMSGAREENRSRPAMWVTVRPRISWWTALTVFLLLHSGEEKDFSPFLSPPRTFPLTHPTEMQRHKPGPAIPLPDLKTLPGGILKAFSLQEDVNGVCRDQPSRCRISKKMEQPFEKKYPMRRALIQKRGRYPVPPRSRFLMEGPDFF